jgi:hypothetical protein
VRRVPWLVTTVGAIILAGGCGTMLNVTDVDNLGREAYGGVARDVEYFDQPHSVRLGPLVGGLGGKSALAALVLYPALVLAYPACMAAEVSLSAVGDTCTLPLLPVMDRLDQVIWASGVPPESRPSRQGDWIRETDWLLGLKAPVWDTNPSRLSGTPPSASLPGSEKSQRPEPSPEDLPPLPPLTPTTPLQ